MKKKLACMLLMGTLALSMADFREYRQRGPDY